MNEDSHKDNKLNNYLDKGERQNAVSLPDDPWNGSLFDCAEPAPVLEAETPGILDCEKINRKREEKRDRIMRHLSANSTLKAQIAKLSKVQV